MKKILRVPSLPSLLSSLSSTHNVSSLLRLLLSALIDAHFNQFGNHDDSAAMTTILSLLDEIPLDKHIVTSLIWYCTCKYFVHVHVYYYTYTNVHVCWCTCVCTIYADIFEFFVRPPFMKIKALQNLSQAARYRHARHVVGSHDAFDSVSLQARAFRWQDRANWTV